ncbi:MAG: hypothetical protein H6709_24075 [Kofleriaceae bacterium]|nr:hypothetical protein [Kofleriaceae bacterium]MCB9575166.1 hypothetical protein [Kofleriaceae bacterium]
MKLVSIGLIAALTVALGPVVHAQAPSGQPAGGDEVAAGAAGDDAREDAAPDAAAADDDATDDEATDGDAADVPAADAEPAKPRPKPKKPAPRRAAKKKVSKTGKLDKSEDKVLGGQHWRIESEQGAVHVWVPPKYDRATAGTVVYVHGYYTDADGAWKDHDLAKQFKASRQNAIFIVPDAPKGKDEGVKWPALTDLRKAVARANIRLPDGPTIVMGHSGAFRTVSQWVDHKLVAEVILLDALYGREDKFDEFIGSGKRAEYHKLIVIGSDTAAESKDFAKQYPFAVVRDGMPDKVDGFSRKEKRAKLLYVRSQYRHMPIVTNGKVIPLLLRLTPLKAL